MEIEKQLAEEAARLASHTVWAYSDALFLARTLYGSGYTTPESRQPVWELAQYRSPRELAQLFATTLNARLEVNR